MNSTSFPGEKPWAERGLYEFITRELTQHDGTGNENDEKIFGIATLNVVVLPRNSNSFQVICRSRYGKSQQTTGKQSMNKRPYLTRRFPAIRKVENERF